MSSNCRFYLPLFWAFSLCIFTFQLKAQESSATSALETIGATSAVALYNSYSCIGMMADAYAAEAYEDDFVNTILDEQLGMYDNLKTSYTALIDSGFLTDENDLGFVRDAITALNLLKTEANALKQYIATLEDADNDAFQAAREAAWTKIAEILGL
ncbi:MAG: hypothetical protein HY842_00445 [Bacteroidetes bacterium]|nr:hypothetical protein [Bacteroidota bacterium]